MPARPLSADDALKRLNLYVFYSSMLLPMSLALVAPSEKSRFMIAAVNHVFVLIFRVCFSSTVRARKRESPGDKNKNKNIYPANRRSSC